MGKLKTIRSYTGRSRFNAECGEIVGYLPNHEMPAIDRYSYSPSRTVRTWQGKPVVCIETSHKTYEIWEVDARDLFANENEAEAAYLLNLKDAVAD